MLQLKSADKRSMEPPSTSRTYDLSDEAYFEMVKVTHRLKRFDVSFGSPAGQAGILTKKILMDNTCGANEIVVTVGQVDAGLRLPLYCPLNPF